MEMLQCLNSLSFLFLTVISSSDVKVLVARMEARVSFRRDSTGNISRALHRERPRGARGSRHRLFSPPRQDALGIRIARKKICSSLTASRLGSTFRRTTPSRVFPRRRSTDWRTPLALLAGEMKVSRVCARIRPAINETPESSDHVVLFCELRGAGSEGAEKKGSQDPPPQTGDAGEAVFFEIVKDSGELVRGAGPKPGRRRDRISLHPLAGRPPCGRFALPLPRSPGAWPS